MILTSTLLESCPIVHGFTTRAEGNLGFGKNAGDPEVVANRNRLFGSPGLSGRRHIQPRQVHSNRVIAAAEFVPNIEADACYTDSADDLLSILTADCVPILVYHPDGIVAAIHAGWRGIYEDVIPNALAQLPPRPLVATGPAIGVCCYEVSEDLARDFEAKFGKDVVLEGPGKPHLDLSRAVILQLLDCGVDQMDVCQICTYCHPDLFFSYRREGSAGRLMSFIGLTAKTPRRETAKAPSTPSKN